MARSGRPGPVLVDLPKDVLKASTEFKSLKNVELKSYQPDLYAQLKQLPKVVSLIKEARRPVILCRGRGDPFQGSQELRSSGRRSASR